jgi:hypothetical protein
MTTWPLNSDNDLVCPDKSARLKSGGFDSAASPAELGGKEELKDKASVRIRILNFLCIILPSLKVQSNVLSPKGLYE